MLNKLNPKSEFTKNVITLMTGTTIAQAIPIAISPILTRIYTPEDFGVLALFVAISSIFGSVANGRYELAIMLPKKDEDAINIFAIGFITTSTISFIFLITIIIFHNDFLKLLDNKEISIWLYFLPIATFFISIFNILNYFNNRMKCYKDIAKATVTKSIILSIIQISIGFFKQGPIGLISGQIVSHLFANMKLLKNITKDKTLIASISKAKMFSLAKKYKDFPLHNMPATFADILTLQISILLLPILFNITIIGFFSFAKKIISMPSALISRSISQVLLQKLTYNNNNNKRNGQLLKGTIIKLFLIAFPIFIALYFFSAQIFQFIFGNEWITAGEISKYLSIIFLFQFVASTVSVSLIAYKKIKILALWQYAYLIISLIYFAIVYKFNLAFNIFLKFFTIIEVIFYILYLYLSIYVVYNNDKRIGIA